MLDASRFIKIFDDHSSMMILVDPDTGLIAGVNTIATQFYGYSLDEFVGMKVSTLNTLSEEEVQERIRQAQQDGRRFFTFSHRLKNGEERKVEVNTSLVTLDTKKYLLSIVKDISYIERLNQRIKEERQLYQTLIEVASDGVHILDTEGNVIYCSYSFAKMLGYRYEEAIKLNVRDWEGSLAGDVLDESLSSLFKNPRTFETKHIRKDGSKLDVQINAKGIEVNGLKLLYASSRDITEQKRMTIELETSKKLAESANKAKSEFLANMSHEIRTPLNAVIGLTRILQDTQLDKKQSDLIHKIELSSNILLKLINDILDYSKIEAGKLKLEKEVFHFRSSLENVYNMFEDKAIESNIKFSLNIDKNIPDYIKGDSLRLSQVIINLLGNAFKFTKEGSISIEVNLISKEKKDLDIEFKVSDTGIGIKAEHINKLFKAFEQADKSTTRKFGGTGLGLRLCKKFVKLMGGDIKVDSELEKGSCFSFHTKFKEVTTIDKEDYVDNIKRLDLKKSEVCLDILIVEDNQMNVLVIKNIIVKLGHRCVHAGNGKEALEEMKRQKFDMIFMDLHMPVMDGFECTQEIRETDKDIPIIAVSASVMKEDIDKASSAGVSGHISKPIQIKEFAEVVDKHTKKTS